MMTTYELIVALVSIFFVIGVPVVGLTARLAIRPLLHDFRELLGYRKRESEEIGELKKQLDRIERQFGDWEVRLDQLDDADRFRRQLEIGKGASPAADGAPGAQPAPGAKRSVEAES